MKDNKQAMNDVPRTRGEYLRQKGAIPLIAIFLALGLIGAYVAFFVPAWISQAG